MNKVNIKQYLILVFLTVVDLTILALGASLLNIILDAGIPTKQIVFAIFFLALFSDKEIHPDDLDNPEYLFKLATASITKTLFRIIFLILIALLFSIFI